jgi:hypothetical protein
MRTQNPFSLYDLLGYLIPGLLSILGTSLIFDNDFSKGNLTEGFWNSINISAFDLNHIVPLLVIAYLTGHLLSYLSAMTVEKFSIWSIGYPTSYLFENIRKKGNEQKIFRFEFLKEFFNPVQKPNFFIYILRVVLVLLLLPMILPLIIASLLFNMHITIKKPIDENLATFSLMKIKAFYKNHNFKLGKKKFKNFEWFRPLSHFVTENYPQHAQKIHNYVALYGFNRNICLMFVTFFWFVIVKCIIENQLSNHIFILGVFMLLSLVFYAAFNKFFRRYSLEVIMAFSTN